MPGVPEHLYVYRTNLTIRGAAGGGSRLEMQKHDYMNNKLYVHSEARHAICVSEALHVRISDLEIVNTGGDGIYLAGGCYSEGLSMCPSTDVELLRVTTLGAYRNGLSIVNGRDVVVRDSHFLNTSGTPPEAGIDLEPNTAGDWMFNISFVDTHSRWNRGAGLSLALEKLQCEKARCKLKPYCMCPIVPSLVTVSVAGGEIEGLGSLTLTELAALDYNIGVLVSTGTHADGSQGWLNFSNLAISNTAQPGLEFENKAADSMPVTFTNCSWDDVATAPSVRWGGTNSPILLHQSASGTIGGIQLAECRVRDMKPRPWLKCDSCNDRGSALQLSGTVAVNNTHGCTTKLGTNARNISLRVQCEADAVKAPPRGLWAKYG